MRQQWIYSSMHQASTKKFILYFLCRND